MSVNSNIIISIPFIITLLSIIIFSILKKRKRSAKNIYKLINDLEKKYIY